MASLIKNQILKHLSKFTKNLSPDKVQLSALKGEAELKNLVLDENVLTDVLELPSWIQLTKAVCNRVSVKIQWTKLKSTPIVIMLDEVIVEMETCNILRDNSSNSNRPSYSSGSTYGFSDKVVDGMTVNVNSVTINFKSHAFYASAQLSRIRLESRTPAWKRGNLQMTRVKDSDRGEVLIFKELDWQLLRIEAQALKDGIIDEEATPLRLITNQARCRITIKKKLVDCSVLSSRLVLIMDDLLWVLTDSQLRQAFMFINSFSSLVKQSTELSQKVKGARKLENLPEYMAQANQMSRRTPSNHLSTKSRLFSHYDITETSYHMYSSRIDLHLCDEPNVSGTKPSLPQLENGGALQILLVNLSIDYYPYHLANGERKHWLRYSESTTQRKSWIQTLMSSFHQRLVDLVVSSPYQSKVHTPLHRAAPHGSDDGGGATSQSRQNVVDPSIAKSNGFNSVCSQWKHGVQNNLKKLMSSSFVFRLEDLTVYKVSTGNCKHKPEIFLSRSDFVLPQDVSLVHVEHTMYYYPGDINFPVPAPNLYVNISPLLLIVDITTILWLNSFGLGIQQAKIFDNMEDENDNYLDIKVEALMPKICINGDSLPENQPDRPSSLHLQASRVIATNCRDSQSSSRFDLAKCFNNFGYGSLFFDAAEFPSLETDYLAVPEKFLEYALGKESAPACIIDQSNLAEIVNPTDQTLKNLFTKLSPKLLWTENRAVWSLYLDPFWAEFITIGGSKKKPVPFVDAFPLTLWIYTHQVDGAKVEGKCEEHVERPHHKLLKEYYKDKVECDDNVSDCASQNHGSCDTQQQQQPQADMYSIVHISSLVSVQLNHYQFIFLMRTVDKFTKLTEYLVQDTLSIVGDLSELKSSVCFSAFVPQVQISLLMAMDDNQAKNASVSQNSSSIDLSLGQERVRNSTDHNKSSSSDSQETSQCGSGMRSLTDIPDSVNETIRSQNRTDSVSRMNAINSEESISGSHIVVNVDSSYLPATPQKQFTNDETRSLQSFCDDIDATSIKSDLSSDSEQYVMVDYENHPIEYALLSRSNVSSPRGEPRFEVANEIKDDGDISSSIDDDKKSACSSEKRNDLFQVLTIEINQVQMIQQSCGCDAVVKVTCNHFSIDQGSQPETWHNFQSHFSSKGRVWKESEVKGSETGEHSTIFKLRLDSGPSSAERFGDPTIASVGHLSLLSSNLDLKLRMSILTGLLDLVEDEIIPQPPIMPIKIKATNIKVHLDEDRPLFNITSPGPVPLDIVVHECYINRDSTGTFHIDPMDRMKHKIFSSGSCRTTIDDINIIQNSSKHLHNETSISSMDTVLSSSGENGTVLAAASGTPRYNARLVEELQEQNEQLTFKLISFTALEEENSKLQQQLDGLKAAIGKEPPSALENARLMMKLLEAQDEVKRLENEKKSVMATLQLLQNSLDAYEQRQKKNDNGCS